MVGHKWTRRQLLRTGGATLAAGAVSRTIAGQADTGVPDSPRFNLQGAGGNPVKQKSLHANWVMQSFAYDNVNQHLYFLQHNTTNTDPANLGDLWVTRTDTAGNELGAMALHGFGHGVSLAVEPYQGQVYLWTEWQVRDSGFGDKIGRFRFVDGATLEASSTSIQDRTPRILGAVADPQPVPLPQPIIDPQNDRYLVRYKLAADTTRIVAFPLSDAREGRLTTDYWLVDRALPSRGALESERPFQGFTAYGRYAYLLEGSTESGAFLTTIDLNGAGNDTVENQWQTGAGASLPGREPEGMAIWLTSSGPRLAFGFHSNDGGVRQANVYYKSTFV